LGKARWPDSSFLNSQAALAETAFGQGQLLATPMQMALVAACIANDGQMMAPYLVQSITNQDGDVLSSRDPSVWRTPISEETASSMQNMMIGAVQNGYSAPQPYRDMLSAARQEPPKQAAGSRIHGLLDSLVIQSLATRLPWSWSMGVARSEPQFRLVKVSSPVPSQTISEILLRSEC